MSTTQTLAIFLILVVHVVAVPLVAWIVIAQQGEPSDLRRWWGGDDAGGTARPNEPPKPSGGDALLLPDAQPSPVRLRGPGRIGDAYPAPARRPAHPERAPERVPERVG